MALSGGYIGENSIKEVLVLLVVIKSTIERCHLKTLSKYNIVERILSGIIILKI